MNATWTPPAKERKVGKLQRVMLVMVKGYTIACMNGKGLTASCNLDKGLKALKPDEDGAAVMVPAGPRLGSKVLGPIK